MFADSAEAISNRFIAFLFSSTKFALVNALRFIGNVPWGFWNMPPPTTFQAPVSAGKAAIALIASPPFSVRSRPTPTRIAIALCCAIKLERCSIDWAGTPVTWLANSTSKSRALAENSSKPCVCLDTYSISTRLLRIKIFANAIASTTSVPGRGRMWWSARFAVSVLIGSITTRMAPFFLASRINWLWCIDVAIGFIPQTIIKFEKAKLSGSSPPVGPATIWNALEAVALQKVRSPIEAPSSLKNRSPQWSPFNKPWWPR